ncbi:hypothetical protein CPB84DRAFT_1812882 [Gymnopilus junonius]|uniref:ABC transporter domain-containing protein n=1 Tax=Gymnopilus junonius TaxID=109634 RepID=A0A9P5TSY2_GYMJU|nr:hypothetical protein CPB84DRAFT_1812882 [Gymnopilus junonius]
MTGLFWRQLRAFIWKNWIVLSKHWFWSILRCFIGPILYGAFVAFAQVLLNRLNNYGLGQPVPIFSLQSQFDGKTALIWVDATDGTSNPSPASIISRITSGFTPAQLASVRQTSDPADIPSQCPQNFNLFSQCFAAIAFYDIPANASASRPINYTILADAGLAHIDVVHHKSDFEKRILPLQWSLDQAIIELQTGVQQQTPLEWPFNQETNEEQMTQIRLSYIRGIRTLLLFVGIAYQLPGSVANERSMLITEHLKAMGLLDSARVISWHVAISLSYLPAWIIVSLTWKARVFTASNGGLIFGLHLLLGLVLGSWSLFVAAPFGKSPQLAAVVSTLLAIVFAILGLVIKTNGSGVIFIFSLLFPPSFYMFAIKAICGYENHQIASHVLKGDPDRGIVILPALIAAVIDIFLWPYLAVQLERYLYDARPVAKAPAQEHPSLPENMAISIRDLTKIYKTSRFSSKGNVTAVSNLSLEVPKTGIFVLLGSNGAGKSTALSVIGGLTSISSGTVTFEGGAPRPPRGTLGIVPQKNVLFPELSCIQTLRVWKAVKWSKNSEADEDLEQLLRDCDLEKKINANAATLSGGQKRKLQLAIGLLGGSRIVLVDECTSGVDPLSRRALWKTLTAYREDRTIFLDEADLLADYIAILAAPGKVVAAGPPVALKRDLGEVIPCKSHFPLSDELLQRIKLITPQTYISTPSPSQSSYHLKRGIVKSSVRRRRAREDTTRFSFTVTQNIGHGTSYRKTRLAFKQALTIFYKRLLIARRSWLTQVLTIVVGVAGATIPLVFLAHHQPQCEKRFLDTTSIPLFLPDSPVVPFAFLPSAAVLSQPPGIIAALGNSAALLSTTNIPDNTTFESLLRGVSLDLNTGASLVAWEASPPGYTGPAMLNLATNILYNRALNSTGRFAQTPAIINATYTPFPATALGTLVSLRWIAFFGLVMAIYPAFSTLYVAKERRSSVQAMQLSNGLTNPVGLWLGHLMFDSIAILILSTIIIIVFAVAEFDQFHGLGFLWFTMVLYGVTAALFSYCISLLVSTPLAAFAAVAAYQFVMFLLYIASYLLVLTYGPVTESDKLTTIIHFTISIVAPVSSLARAALVAINEFSLLCSGDNVVRNSSLGTIKKFGGPILYLFVYSFVLLAILVWVDSGSRLPRRLKPRKVSSGTGTASSSKEDVTAAAEAVATSDDALRVLNVSKTFDGNNVVDDISFGVSKDVIFALLGPNGAGKTTTFNIIRGDVVPDIGDVFINGTSVVRHPRTARSSLGVCPQFTAIDSQLTVREHLMIYGRLKGLRKGTEVDTSVEAILQGTSLAIYADRLASKLSGGNQRKLSLAISLIGNPSVVLIDEFSTGIDPKMKRDMWQTLRTVAAGKAVVITTHSMEEASALASSVGILAKRMLAVGTTELLSTRYATYEVHFTCRTREEEVKARSLMSLIPGSRKADDVATRFEVPLILAFKLFNTLASHGDFTEYTVERASLESVFLKVIRENNIKEEDNERNRGRRKAWWRLWP